MSTLSHYVNIKNWILCFLKRQQLTSIKITKCRNIKIFIKMKDSLVQVKTFEPIPVTFVTERAVEPRTFAVVILPLRVYLHIPSCT